MNDQQLEAACRKYCELQGVDPDEKHGFVEKVPTSGCNWELYKPHIKAGYNTLKAIKFALTGVC